jgi:hypothetical protein
MPAPIGYDTAGVLQFNSSTPTTLFAPFVVRSHFNVSSVQQSAISACFAKVSTAFGGVVYVNGNMVRVCVNIRIVRDARCLRYGMIRGQRNLRIIGTQRRLCVCRRERGRERVGCSVVTWFAHVVIGEQEQCANRRQRGGGASQQLCEQVSDVMSVSRDVDV